MLAHHLHRQAPTNHALRVLITIAVLLLMLVLLPIHTHSQELTAPSGTVEIMDQSTSAPSPALMKVLAAEMAILWCVMISYLVIGAQHHRQQAAHRRRTLFHHLR